MIIVESMAPRVRGELSRWMIEVSTGVFVGKLSALVRERLWLRCSAGAEDANGTALMVWRVSTDQGFEVRSANPRGRYPEEIDGIWLVRVTGTNRTATHMD